MNKTEIEVRGTTMRLLTHTRSLELCARMNYETENLDFIDSLPKGGVFYDLGACEGRFGIYAGLKGLQVLAFEPERENFETLVANIENNGLQDVVLAFNVGVGEKTMESLLKIGQPWPGGHQKIVDHNEIREDLDFEFKTEQKIKIVGLDSFIEENNLSKPNFLKIDIDGSEIPFLKGANETLNNVNKIIFELYKNDKSYEYIISFLERFNFTIDAEFEVPNEPYLYNIIFSK